MEKIYLSQRDIVSLLEKLDSVQSGGVSTCTIIKNEKNHPVFPQSLRRINVIANETQDSYYPGVSPRLQISRATLMTLYDQVTKQLDSAIQLEGMEVFAVPNERYYVDRSEVDSMPVGDLGSEYSKKRGKSH